MDIISHTHLLRNREDGAWSKEKVWLEEEQKDKKEDNKEKRWSRINSSFSINAGRDNERNEAEEMTTAIFNERSREVHCHTAFCFRRFVTFMIFFSFVFLLAILQSTWQPSCTLTCRYLDFLCVWRRSSLQCEGRATHKFFSTRTTTTPDKFAMDFFFLQVTERERHAQALSLF